MTERKGVIEREQFAAGLLRIYLYYRFFLSLALLAAFYTHIPSDLFGFQSPNIYLSANIIYVVVTAITLGFYQLQKSHLTQVQLFLNLLVDIVLPTVLMFCSGGLSSGIGYLLLITVAAGAIFFTGQLAVLIPAIASICIILESVFGAVLFDRSTLTVFPAGVLGVFLFVTALIFSSLSRALIQAQEAARSESRISAGLQELNQLIIERMRTGIIVVDGNATIYQINTAARELLGRLGASRRLQIGDSMEGETPLLDLLRQWQRSPEVRPPPFTPRSGNTDLQPSFAALDGSGMEQVIIFLEDMRAQTQKAQQLKLASLGRLTASIAHEIRNPLGAISHASELLGERRDQDERARRLTEIINNHVRRVDHIVDSVLQLSKKQDYSPEKLPLTDWLQEFIRNYEEGHREQPEVELELPSPDAGTITFDPIHLQRILTNLLDNALYFSAEQSGRRWARLTLSMSESGAVLDVEDRGPGVAPEHRDQLFEPFFSLRPGGSGLGLYMAGELCAINFASLKYEVNSEGDKGFFRIVFAHPDKVLKLTEESHERQQGTDH